MILCPNVFTTPLCSWGFRQCLPFSWTTLRGKNCQHPIAVMGVVDTFGQWEFSTVSADWAVFGSTDFFAIFLIANICYFWRCFSSFHGQNQYKIRVLALRTKKLNNIKVRNRTIYVYCTTWYKSLLWRGLSFRVNVQHLTNQSKLTTH